MISYKSYTREKEKPFGYLKIFQQNLSVLKDEVENFNLRQNDSRLANLTQSNNSCKKLYLKKMTQPRYHKLVVGMLSTGDKSLKQLNVKKGSLGRSPLKQQKYTNKKQEGNVNQVTPDLILSDFISEQLVSCSRMKDLQMKNNLLKKQKKLQRQWQITQNFRSHNNIYFMRKHIKGNKKEEAIIKRVQMRKLHSSSTAQFTERSEEYIQTESNNGR